MGTEQSPKSVNRREFIKQAGTAAGVALGAANVANADFVKNIFPQTVLGANEKIRTGHIGIGGMGRSNMSFCLQRDDIQPIALCDLWYKNRDRAQQMVGSKFPADSFTMHHDFREVLDNKDVDAVVIATPDHWHALPTIMAVEAGKDVYCEKPLTTCMAEAIAVRDAVKNSKSVFQGGTMQRSGIQFQEAVELVRSGYIGKVARVETYIYDDDPIQGMGPAKPDMPEKCDWEFHQGWVEHVPFDQNRWIYNFRWFLDYSGGKITDWGAHLLDIAIWAMGQERQPKSVVAVGGKYLMEDNRTTPDTLDVIWEFDDYILSFTNRVWNNYVPQIPAYGPHGILFHGTLGTLLVHRGGYNVFPVANAGKDACEPKEGKAGPMNEPHWENFVNCVRSREKCIVDVDTIYYTTMLCHMGTCAYVGGDKFGWDGENLKFTGANEEAVQRANGWGYREYQNGWSLGAPHKA